MEKLGLSLPVIWFLYKIVDYVAHAIKIRPCDLTASIHMFLLFEFLVILILVLKRSIFKHIFYKYSVELILFILIISLRIYLVKQQQITPDLIYFIRIALTAFIEVLPLLLVRPWLESKYIKVFYTFMANMILFVNLAFFVYFYNTGEPFEYILFENLNWTSVQGFFLDIALKDIVKVLTPFILLNGSLFYYFKIIDKKHDKKYFKALFILWGILTLFYGVLFVGDHYVVGKVCSRYATARKSKNKLVEKIATLSIPNLVSAYTLSYGSWKSEKGKVGNKVKYYQLTQEEKASLNQLFQKGWIQSKESIFAKEYDRIVLLVFESLSTDFIHYYNKSIPKESTAYFDYLLQNYFHLDRFYTSNMPTDYGLTALLKSRLDKDVKHQSIFDLMKDLGYQTYFVRGSTKFYGDHLTYYPKAFGYEHGIFQEEMIQSYGEKYSGWGFDNAYVYRKALEVMDQNRKKKLFLVLKTIDFHLPGPKCNYPDEVLPKGLQKSYILLKSLYWIDSQLKKFMQELKKERLFDEKTLVVITADHNPHLGADFRRFAQKGNFNRLSKIPLIFVTKNKDFTTYASVNDRIFSQIDLAPTLLSMHRVEVPKSFMGRNIFEDSNRSFAVGKYKDHFYYRNMQKQIKIPMKECETLSSLDERALCKYLVDRIHEK